MEGASMEGGRSVPRDRQGKATLTCAMGKWKHAPTCLAYYRANSHACLAYYRAKSGADLEFPGQESKTVLPLPRQDVRQSWRPSNWQAA